MDRSFDRVKVHEPQLARRLRSLYRAKYSELASYIREIVPGERRIEIRQRLEGEDIPTAQLISAPASATLAIVVSPTLIGRQS